MQGWLDLLLVSAPQWAGYALLGLAALVTLPGRHGQRPLNAALIGGGVFAAALFALRGAVHPWVPGAVAIVGGVVAAALALIATRWGTAVAVAALLAAGGVPLARLLDLHWIAGVAAGAGLGLFAGMVNYRAVSLLLPPAFSALFVAVGAAIAWAPHQRGAVLWQLNDVRWTLGAAGVLFAPLLALSLERDYRARLRLKMRTKQMEDEELKKRIAARQRGYERANQPDSRG